MLPFGKISQMSRAIVQKTHTCKHVPLTGAFDCASPNSRINYILNQLSYAKQEKKKQKQRVKAEKQKRVDAKYELRLLPDYTKKIDEVPKAATHSLSSDPYAKRHEYINLKGNKRISPEFLAILKENSKEMDENIKLMEPIRVMTKRPSVDDANKEWENLSPQLAKYLRETMERNDLMRELYDVNFYDREDRQGLKHIMSVLNRTGDTSALTPQQLAKLQAYLQMSSKQSPEEFEIQLQFLSDGGFLNGAMVKYIRNLLKENGSQLSNKHLQNQLAALKHVDKNYTGYDAQMDGGRPLHQQKKPHGGLWSVLQSIEQEQPDKSLEDSLPYDQLQRRNALRFSQIFDLQRFYGGAMLFGQWQEKKRGRWDFLNESKFSQKQSRSSHLYSYEYQNSKMNMNRPKSGGQMRKSYGYAYENQVGNLKRKQTPTYDNEMNERLKSNRNRYYVRHSWETTLFPIKRRKTKRVVEVKKRIEKYEIPPPKPKQETETSIDNNKTDKTTIKQFHLKSRLSEPPKLPDRQRYSDISLPMNELSLRRLLTAISYGPVTELASKSQLEKKNLNKGKA